MNYFQSFSIVFGLLMVGVRLLIHLIPEKWNDFELNHAYTQKRPLWIWFVAIIGIVVVGVTWYMELTSDVRFSIILTLVITSTLIKVSQVLFNYDNFRKFVKKALIDDRSIIVKINIATTVLGIALVLLGIFVY
ncbi:hypothetical protein [Alkaliphilus transvaalensis]|uniref:hypothetical protein n=1 Tax=Alkaliphilus transvaalensis TaxID=114628 RepID=UPI000479131D|nr:hypothetical protein [Alkaliphilus transvaalensis]